MGFFGRRRQFLTRASLPTIALWVGAFLSAACALLAEAGYADGLELRLLVAESSREAYEEAPAAQMFLAGWGFTSGEVNEFYECCLQTPAAEHNSSVFEPL